MAQAKLQRTAPRNPDNGIALLPEVLEKAYLWNSSGSGLILSIPASADEPVVLMDLYHVVTTAFSGGTPSFTVGDGTDVDAYLASADIAETTLGAVVRMSDKANAKSGGEYLTSNLQITVTLSASLAAGGAKLLAVVYRLA